MEKDIKELFSLFFKDKSIRRLKDNFFSLSLLQGANYLLPLITVPYLVRVLGIEKFGLIMFAQAFITYITIITDYGFNLSATRQIAIYREEKKKLSEIFSAVFSIKLLLLLACSIILIVLVFSFDKFYDNFKVYFFYFGIVIGNVLFPVWIFQGLENMRYITLLNLLSKVVFTLLIFVYIKSPDDFLLAPIFQSLGYIIAGSISLFIIIKKFEIQLRVPQISLIKYYFADSTPYFISRVSASLYTNTNTFIIGLVLGNSFVGIYTSAEKIFNAITSMYTPLNDALYPYMSKNKNIALFKKIFWAAIVLNTIICLGIGLGSDFIIQLIYGSGFNITADLLKIFALVCFFMVPAILLGYPLLGALGFQKYANYSVVCASILHVILLLLLIPVMNLYLVTALLVFTQIVVLGIRFYGVRTKIENF